MLGRALHVTPGRGLCVGRRCTQTIEHCCSSGQRCRSRTTLRRTVEDLLCGSSRDARRARDRVQPCRLTSDTSASPTPIRATGSERRGIAVLTIGRRAAHRDSLRQCSKCTQPVVDVPHDLATCRLFIARAVGRQRLAGFERAEVRRLAGEAVVDIRQRDAAIDRRRRQASGGSRGP